MDPGCELSDWDPKTGSDWDTGHHMLGGCTCNWAEPFGEIPSESAPEAPVAAPSISYEEMGAYVEEIVQDELGEPMFQVIEVPRMTDNLGNAHIEDIHNRNSRSRLSGAWLLSKRSKPKWHRSSLLLSSLPVSRVLLPSLPVSLVLLPSLLLSSLLVSLVLLPSHQANMAQVQDLMVAKLDAQTRSSLRQRNEGTEVSNRGYIRYAKSANLDGTC